MWKDPEARDNLRVQGACSKRGGVAMMRNKEMEITSLDSRKLPWSLMFPLPAILLFFRTISAIHTDLRALRKEAFPLPCPRLPSWGRKGQTLVLA